MTAFFTTAAIDVGDMQLDEQAAHHARVRRLGSGDQVVITDGRGRRGTGRVAAVAKRDLTVTIDAVELVPAPPPINLFLPVADRDRMLWLAEKATELQLTTWAPVLYHRSKSVVPRGEGAGFDRKVRARMIGALEQSGGAWLPVVRDVGDLSTVQPGDGSALVLERGGLQLNASVAFTSPVTLVVGPEGGFEADELGMLRDNGWTTASLGDVTLRFETAAMAAVAVVRSAIERVRGG